MSAKEKTEHVAWRVVDMYDPHELADVGGDEYGLFRETVWLLEDDPQKVLDWLVEV